MLDEKSNGGIHFSVWRSDDVIRSNPGTRYWPKVVNVNNSIAKRHKLLRINTRGIFMTRNSTLASIFLFENMMKHFFNNFRIILESLYFLKFLHPTLLAFIQQHLIKITKIKTCTNRCYEIDFHFILFKPAFVFPLCLLIGCYGIECHLDNVKSVWRHIPSYHLLSAWHK